MTVVGILFPMHNFKYLALITKGEREDRALSFVRSQCLKPICEAFANNLLRAGSFAFMPAQVAARVRREQKWTDQAVFQVTGKLTGSSPRRLSKANYQKYLREFRKLSRQFTKLSPEKHTEMIRKAGVEYVERLVKVSHGMHQSMEAIMSSVVLESWTAFEILASDLWVAAVDNGPKEIPLRVSVANRWERVDEDLFRRGLPELEYDPRKEYGRHLREIGRVSFQKLDRIIKYYSIAFENNIAALFDEACDGYIYALSAYRNILIHHAGNADKTFVKKVERFPELRAIKANQKLLLDGELVRKLRNAAILLGTRLVFAVDYALKGP